jgi:glycosyltransferase involved in cell wall biosynthesis
MEGKKNKVIGITRVRNESKIIKNTLDHVSNLVDAIIVCDDASTDNTVEICENHPSVLKVIKNENWASDPRNRNIAEGLLRQLPYVEALKEGADWVYYFDADEYADFSMVDFNADVDTYWFRLFDFYITEEDKNDDYLTRKYMGPEFRDIPMLFRPKPHLRFIQRIPSNHGIRKAMGGYVKHYGKAISVEEWDKTCEYYINHRWKGVRNDLWERWKKRVGKAIHTKSDFDTELMTWDERFDTSKIIKIG